MPTVKIAASTAVGSRYALCTGTVLCLAGTLSHCLFARIYHERHNNGIVKISLT